MITSRIAEKHREHAMELGVNHYLGKPYSEDELLGLVRHYCAVEKPTGLKWHAGVRRRVADTALRPSHDGVARQRLSRASSCARRVRVVLAQRTPAASSSMCAASRAHARQRRAAGQLRQVAADELALRIELLALADRVEDAEVGLGVAAAGAGPLPAAVVGRQVEVVELLGESSARPSASRCPGP
jgi:DNA-binding response OmpR family regulator